MSALTVKKSSLQPTFAISAVSLLPIAVAVLPGIAAASQHQSKFRDAQVPKKL